MTVFVRTSTRRAFSHVTQQRRLTLASSDVQVEQSGQAFVSSDPEDCELTQDGLEDRRYPGEVTTASFKVKFQPKDAKKELLA